MLLQSILASFALAKNSQITVLFAKQICDVKYLVGHLFFACYFEYTIPYHSIPFPHLVDPVSGVLHLLLANSSLSWLCDQSYDMLTDI